MKGARVRGIEFMNKNGQLEFRVFFLMECREEFRAIDGRLFQR